MAAAQRTPTSEPIQIDSLVILKNWRTRDAIIREELNFKEGDILYRSAIDTAIMRIWNIGNFARVRYELDTLANGKTLLKVIAQDALTILPILSFSGNKKDWNLTLGLSDNNFLGRNIRMDVKGTLGTNLHDFSFGLTIPRQLLYRNMSVGGDIAYGYGTNYRYRDRERTSVVAYSIERISGTITNPWNEDFTYRFSPNFGWSLFRHKTDTSLVNNEVNFPMQYKVKYLGLSLGESFGFVQRQRHQLNGFEMSLGVGAGIGLDHSSPWYCSINYGLQYHRLFNRMMQLSVKYSTGYTTSDIPSLLYYEDANSVKGIRTGEIAGKAYYTAYLGWHLTYINRDWFALEQSFYLNWGNGNDTYIDIYKTKPLGGLGTGIFMNIPMIPWLSARVFVTYSGKKGNWFGLQL